MKDLPPEKPRFVTVARGSSESLGLVTGSFSSTHVAISVTISQSSKGSHETFEIIPREKIDLPSIWRVLADLFRVRQWIWFLFPTYFLVQKSQDPFDPLHVLVVVLFLISTFVSLGLANDYIDHVEGLDRSLQTAGTQVIQRGWFRAHEIRSYSGVFFILSVLSGVSLLFLTWNSFAIGVGALGLTFAFINTSKKFRIFRSVFQSVLMGPLLFLGLELALFNRVTVSWQSFSLVWGLWIFFLGANREFSGYSACSELGLGTLIGRLGFDRSKWVLPFLGCLILIGFIAQQILFESPWTWISTVSLTAVFLLRYAYSTHRLKSPLGSEVQSVRKQSEMIFILFTFLLFLQTFLTGILKSLVKHWLNP